MSEFESAYTPLEQMARFMCGRTGEWVDLMVTPGKPMIVTHGFACGKPTENWRYYVRHARDAVDAAVFAGFITQADADKFLG